jgi:hypothetical protein
MTDISILDIPLRLGEAIGISTFAAGILCSVIVLLIPILFIIILTRGKGMLAAAIIGIPLMGFCVVIGWFPIFLMILTCLVAAGFIALWWKGILS